MPLMYVLVPQEILTKTADALSSNAIEAKKLFVAVSELIRVVLFESVNRCATNIPLCIHAYYCCNISPGIFPFCAQFLLSYGPSQLI